MITKADIMRIMDAAWREASSRGLKSSDPEWNDTVVQIAMDMLWQDAERERVEKRAQEQMRAEEEQQRYYKRNPHMHPDNWVMVMFDDKHAVFYRKDSGPPTEVVEGLASGHARIVDRRDERTSRYETPAPTQAGATVPDQRSSPAKRDRSRAKHKPGGSSRTSHKQN